MLTAAVLSVVLVMSPSHPDSARAPDLTALVRNYVAEHTTRGTWLGQAHSVTPSFSRQTGIACSACHTSFPQLTAFGRLFKLNGYTITGLRVVQVSDSNERQSLKLNLIPPVSAMVVTSLTRTSSVPPGIQNNEAQFPQEVSLFFAGEISPRIGTFLQLTYAGNSGSIGIDNFEIRFANHALLASKDLLYGVTLNNNPGVQDVWNSVPAWRFPFVSAAVAPSPAAAPLLEGGLAQRVAGVGGYAIWNSAVYAEYTAYRSAPQGGPHPADASAANTIQGVASYWRAFVQHTWNEQTAMLGTFGVSAKLYPAGVAGAVNRYRDAAVDGQYERRIGGASLTMHGSWLREQQHFDAAVAAGAASSPSNTLDALRLDAGLVTASRVGMTLGYFSTSGPADHLLYPVQPVRGSATGHPDSRGVIGELSFMPWLNTRFGAQYVAYSMFNGGTNNYDGAGRHASDNNTLYLFGWLVF